MVSLSKDNVILIFDVWLKLQKEKKLYRHKVFNKFPSHKLSNEKLEKPEIQQHIRDGYFHQEYVIPDNEIQIFDFFTDLGYLIKREEKIYKISWFYEAHPYVPDVDLEGFLGLNLNSRNRFTHNYFDEKQYQNFVETANFFKTQISSGNHRHIRFDYNIEFSYDTTSYEIANKYYDAIKLELTENFSDIKIFLTEPLIKGTIKSGKTTYRKELKIISEVPKDDFLQGSSKIDSLIETLDWKKKIHGYVFHEDTPYALLTESEANNETRKRELERPNFFDTDVFDQNNVMSRIFEDNIADYMRKENYLAKTRVKYHGKEIDVFCEQSDDSKRIVICECKLRVNDSPLTVEELEIFNNKRKLVLENETVESCEFWFVSNTTNTMDGVKEYAETHNIQMKTAFLPKKWKTRSDWSINKLEDYDHDN